MPRTKAPRPYLAFGRRFVELLEAQRMNFTEFAAAADIAISYPSKFASGESRPRLPLLRRMAEVLQADFDELAALAGYLYLEDRPMLPGWDRLRDEDRAYVRRTVALLADLNRQAAGDDGSTRGGAG